MIPRKQAIVTALALMAALTMTPSMASGRDPQAKQSEVPSKSRERTITGAWRTVVTPRNCQTGDPVSTSLTIPGLFTFNEGGTMSEFGIGPGQTPALRSPGHGVWQRASGWQDYSFAFTFYRYSATGAFIGTQKVTATLVLGAGGDEFTASSTVEVFDAAGNLVGGGCATSVGTRFQ